MAELHAQVIIRDYEARQEPTRASTTLARSQGIEILRILAAYGIVAFHSRVEFADVAYSGLIVFLILAPAVDIHFNFDRVRSIRRLAQTLLIPYVFWWCVYGVLNLAAREPFISPLGWSTVLLGGTSVHLWFLPFMFIVLAAVNALKVLTSSRIMLFGATAVATAILTTADIWRLPSMTWELPFPQWMHALPAVCIGIILGLSKRVGYAVLLPSITVAGVLLWALVLHQPGVGVPYAVGSTLAVLAMLSTRHPAWSRLSVQPIASCMFGVYLTHILWLRILHHFLQPPTYLVVTLNFALALISVYFARRLVPISRLVLG